MLVDDFLKHSDQIRRALAATRPAGGRQLVHADQAETGSYAVPNHGVVTPNGRSFTCIVYLNSAAECSGGTSFFRFEPIGQMQRDAQFDALSQQHPVIVETGHSGW